MKHIKLYEEFKNSNLNWDFDTEFTCGYTLGSGISCEDSSITFYLRFNLKNRIVSVEIPNDYYDEISGYYHDRTPTMNDILNGKANDLIEHLNVHLKGEYEEGIIPKEVYIDIEEPFEGIKPAVFLAKIKVGDESYDSWAIKTKIEIGKRVGKKFGI